MRWEGGFPNNIMILSQNILISGTNEEENVKNTTVSLEINMSEVSCEDITAGISFLLRGILKSYLLSI